MIAYNVPPHCDRCDEPAEQVVRITREEAIARQKEAAATLGYVYTTDQRALDDFMVMYWAWEEP